MSTSFMSRTRIETAESKGISFAPVSSNLKAFGFNPHSNPSTAKQTVSKDTDFRVEERMRRSSSLSNSRRAKGTMERRESSSLAGYDPDPFASALINGSVTENSYNSAGFRPTFRPLKSEYSSPLKRSRGSILVQASEALNSRFGRRRKSVRQPPVPVILPGVIEICAPRHDEEVEERERLRDAAAQSIGLGLDILQDTQSRDNSLEEVDEEQDDADEDPSWGFEMVESPTIGRFARSSSISSMPAPGLPPTSRQRSGSLAHSLTHVRTRSTTPASSALSFPTTPASLKQSTVMSAILPKYYQPASLLVFALSKQWKNRFMILSSPVSPSPSRGQTPPVSYLHLFKSSSLEEREIERLEINEDSVVFVADEEVGGRKGVVKVRGVDVGASRKESNQDAGGRTMWLLQILDPAEAQKWIAAIKTTILGQRSMRAGLGLPAHPLEENAPRGDMDVMLSMRAQGLMSSSIPESVALQDSGSLSTQTTSPGPVLTPDPSRSSSPAMTTKSHHSGPVSALKGLFTGSTRPRSPSRATSIHHEPDTTEDSFGAMGSNLLQSTGDVGMSPLSIPSPSRSPIIPTTAAQRISISPLNVSSLEQRIDQQIITCHSDVSWSSQVDANDNRQIHATSVGTLCPLQPPPNRKPWTSYAPKLSGIHDSAVYKHNNGNSSVAGNFGLESSPIEEKPFASPTLTATSFSIPEQRARAGSLQSVSTVASVELGGAKRWSRQGVLSKRLTPPSGPRPPITDAQGNRTIARLQTQYPYSGERSSSPSSSYNSPQSGPASSSKRESISSAYSVSTVSTSHSRTNGYSTPRHAPSQRRSIPPPPRPVPNFAPPPPPSHSTPSLSPVTPRQSKTSFRDSVTRRALRLSLSSPKPPPSAGLPPRPDETGYRSHRRNSSNGSTSPTVNLYPIPSSMIPTSPRYPPPSGPLPPPPLTSSMPVSRRTSIKQRLRILSAPSSTPSVLSLTSSAHATIRSSTPPTCTLDPYMSQPSTPICEPITMDPNFLQFASSEPRPRSPKLPRPLELFPNAPELTSLSPPPRRGSRQISTFEKEKLDTETTRCHVDEHKDCVAEETERDKPMSLSRRCSVISLILPNS